jgi:hypothetical protein
MQTPSEHPEPLPFILLAYAPDESIGAEIERARIAKAIAANRLKKSISYLISSLGRDQPAKNTAASCFGGSAHRIEQAARAIAGRLIPQLPARRRFHRTLLISAGPSSLGQSSGPSSRGTHGRA